MIPASLPPCPCHQPRRLILALLLCAWSARADDDDGGGFVPPTNPGPGYGGVSGAPPLPPGYVVDRSTIPHGVQTIYNTGDQTGDPHLHTRLAFSPGLGAIDWVSLVFQNSEQQDDPDHVPGPGGGGDGLVSISLYQQMDLTMGTLSGLLGTTDAQTIPEGTLGWFTFQFPETVNLTPGATYYLAFNISEGYSVDTAGVYGNVSSEFRPYNFWYDQFWESRGSPMSVLTTANEFLFAEGVITAIPEPAQAAAVAGASLFLAAMLRRKLRQRRK